MSQAWVTGTALGDISDPIANEGKPFIALPLTGELTLGEDEVHVWLANLKVKTSELLNLWETLSADERARALKFRFQRECDRFIVGRGLLRALLGFYLGLSPKELRFTYGEYGKPALSNPSETPSVEFNLSHSDDVALFAVARGRRVGVDIERMRPDDNNEQVAAQFFSPTEQESLRVLPPELRRRAFFACWTRKEAFIKARGEGLSLPLDEFDVTLAPGEPAALLRVRCGGDDASRWLLRDLVCDPDHVAALAVERHDWQLKCWRLTS
jgi:4'-phosphopantetheinyl transferase